jgi:hypothetical protein
LDLSIFEEFFSERIGYVTNLKRKVNQFEAENVYLKNEVAKYRQIASDTEASSHSQIEEKLKQLEVANHRVCFILICGCNVNNPTA